DRTPPLHRLDIGVQLRRPDGDGRALAAARAAVLPDLPALHRRWHCDQRSQGLMGRHKKLRPYGSPKFALFGETLLAGLVVALCSLPIVTAVPAIAAGARHIRRHNEGYSDRVSDLFGEVRGAFRRLWALGVCSAAVLALLEIDARVLSIAAIPGARPVAIVLAVAALAAAVVVLRFAGGWDPSDRALPGLRRALTESVADPLGST